MTEDWPELTTYFDAEIIGGSRYGFLTSDKEYGASEAEDMTHWGRFPAFRSIKSDLKRPGLTISERELARRGVVFMRWKERFLVPDWKVRDINGASFAGKLGAILSKLSPPTDNYDQGSITFVWSLVQVQVSPARPRQSQPLR